MVSGKLSPLGVDSTQAVLKDIGESLKGMKDDSAGVHIDKVEINNPEPEKASDSLPRTIRKMAYVS